MKLEPHPWSEFLKTRANCIDWLASQGKTPVEIAQALSMDADQVLLIMLRPNEVRQQEEKTMNREELELLRQWVRAELEYALASRIEGFDDYRKLVKDEEQAADSLFQQLLAKTAS